MKLRLLTALVLAVVILAGCGSRLDEPPEPLPEAAYWPGINSITRQETTPEPTVEPSYVDTTETDERPGVYDYMEQEEATEPAQTPAPQMTATPIAAPPGVVNPFPATFLSPFDENGQLSTTLHSWGFVRNSQNQPPPLPGGRWGFDIREFNGLHLGDISGRYVYLTFDLGYEYRFTPVILDILKEKDVHAAFFITGGYLRQNPDLVRRMADEGHVIANHGNHHRSNPALTEEQLVFEIMEVDRLFYELIGEPMSRFFRPPYGEFSPFSLDVTNQLGWKTVFWSIAYVDWITTNQPGRDYVIDHFQTNIHNGAIPLLHTVSQSNAEALPYVIDWLRDNGYVFKSLYDLP